MTRESDIERAVCTYARKAGCLVLKLAAPGQRGQPDRMFIYHGRVAFLEFKSPGKKPTPLQKKWLCSLHRHGLSASWTDDPADAIKWLADVLGINLTEQPKP